MRSGTDKGVLKFNIWNTGERLMLQQIKHIKIVLDCAFMNDLYFGDQGRNCSWDTDPSFIV